MEYGCVIFLAIIINLFLKTDTYLKGIPRDTEVKVNDSTYMNCSTSLVANQVQWRHGRYYVFTGIAILEPYNERFSVEINTSTGACNLVIRSVQPSDAGRYDCVEDEGFGEQRTAQLVVLDDDPVCISNMHSDGVIGPNSCGIEPEEIKLSCSVTYHGDSLPILQWKAIGDNQSITDGRFNVTSSNHEVTYTLTMKSTLGLINSSYICQPTRTYEKHYRCSSNVINIISSNETNRMSFLALLVVPALGVIIVAVVCCWRKRNVKKRRLDEKKLKQEEQDEQEKQRLLGLIATIRTKAAEEGNKAIHGLTILDKKLFVASKESSEVEVYDSMEFSFIRRWKSKELIRPQDLVSCDRNKCLYISDDQDSRRSSEILRFHPNGKLIKKWSTKGEFGRLSVTYESNVIFSVRYENKLNEYSPDGQLVREINLSFDEGFRYPRHAIKLTNGHFVVSHGPVKMKDGHHRVCIVDTDGTLLKSFGGECGSTIGQTNTPAYLSVDGNGFFLVADFYNSRVLQLDSDLKYKREILSEEHGLQYPYRILLDESNGRLFVADNQPNNHRILIFKL